MSAITVHVVVGYLGSGKTTLVERLVRHLVDRGRHVALVVNEMADLDVDGAILHDAHGHHDLVDVLGIAGGCVCCDLGDELVEALTRQLDRPGVDTVLLETTGLAALPQVLASVRRVLDARPGRARLGSCIGLLDAARLEEQERRWPASEVHLGGADLVIVNHVDEATASARRHALRRAHALAPNAVVVEATFADVDCEGVLATAHLAGGGADLGVDSQAGFSQSTFVLERPIDAAKLEALLRRHGAIVRMKGIARVTGREGPQVLQWMPGAPSLRVTPHSSEEDVGYVVAIGRRVRWDLFMDGLSACLAPRRRPRRAVAPKSATVH